MLSHLQEYLSKSIVRVNDAASIQQQRYGVVVDVHPAAAKDVFAAQSPAHNQVFFDGLETAWQNLQFEVTFGITLNL